MISGILPDHDGTNTATNLSDANYDGTIDEKDVDQIVKIISGEEKKLTFIDSADRIVTIKKPVERIILFFDAKADMMRMLNAGNKVVAIGSGISEEKVLLQDISEKPIALPLRCPSFFPAMKDACWTEISGTRGLPQTIESIARTTSMSLEQIE